MFARSLLASLLLISFTALAEDPGAQQTTTGPSNTSGSEYLHQAVGGVFELTPGLNVRGITVDRKNTNSDITQSLLSLNLKGEYGFSDLFSLHAKLDAGTGRTGFTECGTNTACDDTRQRGLKNPELGANFRVPAGLALLRFGATLSLSVQKSQREANGDTNLSSGGTSLTPYFGAEFLLGRSRLGGLLAYDVYSGDRDVNDKKSSPYAYKYTGGNNLGAAFFYEYNFPRIVALGGAISYNNATETKLKVNGTTTSREDAFTGWNFKVYVPLHFNSRVTLVPDVNFGVVHYKSASLNIDGVSFVQVGVISRFAF